MSGSSAISNAPHVMREQRTVKFGPTVIESFERALDSAVKIVGVSDDHALVARCEQDTQAALGSEASAARSQPYYLDVTHPDANKGAVVSTLSKLLSVPMVEIATIGDMPNDVLMFRKRRPQHRHGECQPGGASSSRSGHRLDTTTKALPKRLSASFCPAAAPPPVEAQ